MKPPTKLLLHPLLPLRLFLRRFTGKRGSVVAGLAVVLACAPLAASAGQQPAGEGPANVVNSGFNAGLDGWSVRDAAGRITAEPLAQGPAAFAARAEIRAATGKVWDVQLRQLLDTSLEQGERVVITAWMRSGDVPSVPISIQTATQPVAGIIFGRVSLSAEWRQVKVQGRVKLAARSGDAQLVFNLATAPGTVELTDVRISFPDRTATKAGPGGAQAQSAPVILPPVDLASLPIPGMNAVPGGDFKSLVPDLRRARLMGAQYGSSEIVAVQGQQFKEAIRVRTEKPTLHPYQFQVALPTLAAVHDGDTLLAVFSFRPVEINRLGGYATTEFSFEQAGGAYTKSATWGASGSDGWQHVALPFKVKGSYPAGGAQMLFRAGYGEQTIELGGIYLVNFGQNVVPADLPHTRRTYGGSEPDAPWRAAAARRIEQLRKADGRVLILDAAGRPVANARVRVKLTRNAFGFGTAINVKAMPADPAAGTNKYADEAARMFNWGVFENGMKWIRSEDPQTQHRVGQVLDWMEGRHWTVRGHAAIWPSWRRSPPAIKQFADQPDELRKVTIRHVHDVVARYAGRIRAWDVINEPYINHDMMDVLGDGIMADWFKAAQAADPHAKLFLNDNQLISDPSPEKPRVAYYLDLVKKLRAQGARVDGMGFQGHFGWNLPSIPDVLSVLDKFAALNLELQVTEFDIAITDEALQEQYTKDLMTAVFSHPRAEAFMFWGFWAGQHWKPEAAMFRKDWSMRPFAKAYLKLTRDVWTTNEELSTDGNGEISFRGFLGDYEVDATRDGRTEQGVFTLTRDAGLIHTTLSAETTAPK